MGVGRMKLLALIAIALFAFVALAEEDSDVLVLTSDNFEETIKENPFVMVEFYAPWCGHCKRLAPIYDEVAAELKDTVPVAKIDCDAEKELCGRSGIRGFPTLKFYKNGAAFDYNGGRTKEAIVNYINKKSGPPTIVLSSQEEVDAFVAKSPVVVGFFTEQEGDNYDAFLAAADSLDDYAFGEVRKPALVEALKGTNGQVRFFRGEIGDDVDFDFSGDSEISGWINANSLPLVGEITPENYAKYAGNKIPLLLAFVDLEDEEQKEQVISAFKENAPNFVGKYTFGYIDGQKFLAQAGKMGASGNKLPVVITLDFDFGRNIVYDEEKEITKAGIKEFVEGMISGDIAYVPKSEPIPENNDGPVTTLVGKNFEEIVNDETKDVLVEFYAPWCGHCKNLAPIYQQLGEAFKDVDSVVIAQVDATANDVPVQIQGYPTIKFYPANNKAGMDYNKGRALEDFVEFVKEHASVAIEKEVTYEKEEL